MVAVSVGKVSRFGLCHEDTREMASAANWNLAVCLLRAAKLLEQKLYILVKCISAVELDPGSFQNSESALLPMNSLFLS